MSTNKVRVETVSQKEAWPGMVDDKTKNSFKGGFTPSRVHGPVRLLRLLYDGAMGPEGFSKRASYTYGTFWCLEEDVMAIKTRLVLDLKRQQRTDKVDHATYLNRLAFALRDGLRQKLAICHDWSPRLDTFARMTIPHQQAVYGLVGEAAGQPPYSKDHPDYKKAIAPDTMLSGGVIQYVINFNLPANEPAKKWVEESPSFNLLYR